jgi:hypothetical protein
MTGTKTRLAPVTGYGVTEAGPAREIANVALYKVGAVAGMKLG